MSLAYGAGTVSPGGLPPKQRRYLNVFSAGDLALPGHALTSQRTVVLVVLLGEILRQRPLMSTRRLVRRRSGRSGSLRALSWRRSLSKSRFGMCERPGMRRVEMGAPVFYHESCEARRGAGELPKIPGGGVKMFLMLHARSITDARILCNNYFSFAFRCPVGQGDERQFGCCLGGGVHRPSFREQPDWLADGMRSFYGFPPWPRLAPGSPLGTL